MQKKTEARVFESLNAINEAILRAQSEAELYQSVCEAAVGGGGIRAAGVFKPDGDVLSFYAGSGRNGVERLRAIKFPLNRAVESRSVVLIAFKGGNLAMMLIGFVGLAFAGYKQARRRAIIA